MAQIRIFISSVQAEFSRERRMLYVYIRRAIGRDPRQQAFIEGVQSELVRKSLTNSALLLFAKDPQAYFLPSEVKCAQFYGTKVQKPAPMTS